LTDDSETSLQGAAQRRLLGWASCTVQNSGSAGRRIHEPVVRYGGFLLFPSSYMIQFMDAERVRAQLDRILASAAFADAERASSFLRFVVLRALAGRTGEIKESVIAVEALGRSPSFDSKSDAIVRVEARRLRDRLESYYRREGAEDPVVISLPKGGYIPEFLERQPASDSPSASKRSSISHAGWALFGLAALALLWLSLHKAPPSAGSYRFSILPPDRTAFEFFAISPDGRTLAFTATWKGNTMLWVRPLDSLEAKPLPGTEHASQPFWSPDSRTIGFFTNAKLKTIGITGGPTRDIADVVVGRGACWSRDGLIVFAPTPLSMLYQVSASGGISRPVTSLDTSRSEISHALPQFLPDGQQFLYLAASARPGVSAIRVGSVDGKASRILVGADTGAAYVPSSGPRPASLLFVSGDALIAQPFDLGNLGLTGEKAVIAPEVRYRRWREPGFSVSGNGILLYQAGTLENRRFTWFDRQGRILSAVGPPNDFEGFDLSPDEQHLALWNNNDPATPYSTVWLMDLSRDGAVSRFSDLATNGPEFLPVWSPDGRELIFSRGDERRMRLLRQALSGGAIRTVLDSDGPKFPSDWSSDGRFVAFSSQWPDYQDAHVWTVEVDGVTQAHPFAQHSYSEEEGYFSPAEKGNGPRWIAYTSAETGRDEICVREFPSGAHRWTASTSGGWAPQWSRNGRELFYIGLDGTLMAVTVRSGATLQLGMPQRLFPTGVRPTPMHRVETQYSVSSDGQRFLLNAPAPGNLPPTITAVLGW
jgi:eukaryotic-like serine/threonine-protein kinase